tara:strand:+ start:256 stop:729 length:474 start_codon:yes stop_codon:yes gene_type:complete
MRVHYSSNTNEWATPDYLFKELDKEFNFTLDPCATKENAKCKKYYTMEDDGLKQNWEDHIVFMNPPYGREIGRWVKKAYHESLNGSIVVCLIPARTDTTYWHKYVFPYAEIRFIKGRVKFGSGLKDAPFPSAVAIFSNKDQEEWIKERGWRQMRLEI